MDVFQDLHHVECRREVVSPSLVIVRETVINDHDSVVFASKCECIGMVLPVRDQQTEVLWVHTPKWLNVLIYLIVFIGELDIVVFDVEPPPKKTRSQHTDIQNTLMKVRTSPQILCV